MNRLLRGLGSPPADVLTALFEHWPAAAGPALAAHARPARLVNRRLTVDVDDPVWAAQVRLQESELVARLGEFLGDGKVQFIRPRVAGGRNRDGHLGR
ncbi:MAG: DciA family protein [bacterium]|nr:DciA family protein [bacterium]